MFVVEGTIAPTALTLFDDEIVKAVAQDHGPAQWALGFPTLPQ